MTRKPTHGRPRKLAATQPVDNTAPEDIGRPVFAQPDPTGDPTKFKTTHPSDGPTYKTIDALNKEHKLASLPFPPPRGGPEPRLTLAEVLHQPAADQKINAAGQIVFHAVGDTGNTRGPESQNMVADKLVSDFDETDAKELPLFFFHLGDVIYSFGEAAYY